MSRFQGLIKAAEGRNRFVQRFVSLQEIKSKKILEKKIHHNDIDRETNRLLNIASAGLQLGHVTKELVELRNKYGPLQISRREYLEREAASVGLQLPAKSEDLPTLPDDKDPTKWR